MDGTGKDGRMRDGWMRNEWMLQIQMDGWMMRYGWIGKGKIDGQMISQIWQRWMDEVRVDGQMDKTDRVKQMDGCWDKNRWMKG